MSDARYHLERRVICQAGELGHTIPHIAWDADGHEGVGTCTRCGDGVLLYVGPEGMSIGGTAYESACPGDTCDHGWQVLRTTGARVVLRCLHCGAVRTEDP